MTNEHTTKAISIFKNIDKMYREFCISNYGRLSFLDGSPLSVKYCTSKG